MPTEQEIQKNIFNVLEGQKFGIFTSVSELNDPHPTLVAYTISTNLKEIVFATPESTRKFRNIILRPHVSFFWDSRINSADDIKNAFTVSAIGEAEILNEPQLSIAKQAYLKRHPYMEDFIETPTTRLVSVKVKRFELVSQFQNVFEYIPF
jgi:general stress protein 26